MASLQNIRGGRGRTDLTFELENTYSMEGTNLSIVEKMPLCGYVTLYSLVSHTHPPHMYSCDYIGHV